MPNLKCEKGVTLIELLIALTIFSVGLLSIAGMQIISLRTNGNSGLRSELASVGQGELEKILSRPADDDIFDSTKVAPPKTGIDHISISHGGTNVVTYDASYTVTPDSPVAGMAKVEILVALSGEPTSTQNSFVGYKGNK